MNITLTPLEIDVATVAAPIGSDEPLFEPDPATAGPELNYFERDWVDDFPELRQAE